MTKGKKWSNIAREHNNFISISKGGTELSPYDWTVSNGAHFKDRKTAWPHLGLHDTMANVQLQELQLQTYTTTYLNFVLLKPKSFCAETDVHNMKVKFIYYKLSKT